MKKICPHCGKKSKITCHVDKPTKYSVYDRISKYKCKNCGGHLVRSKTEPSLQDNIVISIIVLVSGVLFYFLLWDNIIAVFLLCAMFFVNAYCDLGSIDAYFPKKLLPADERDILYIPKPDALLVFENPMPKRLKRYDVLTARDGAASLFCVKLDYDSNTAHCRFLTGGDGCCPEPTDLYINGKFKISCIITYI